MQLKTQTDYAIRIMLYLSDKKEGTRKEMAAALGINEFYLPKITRPLRENQWISSLTGSDGGYRLTSRPENITLLDIIELMEGPVNISQHLNQDSETPGVVAAHSLRQVFQEYQEQVIKYFSSITLQDLLTQNEN
jgi:Rrf2 family protein